MKFTLITLTLVSDGGTDASGCYGGWGVGCDLEAGSGCSIHWGGPLPCNDPCDIEAWCENGSDYTGT